MEKGVQFKRMGKKQEMRSVFEQNNGDFILADDCKCETNFSVKPAKRVPTQSCPIDQHRAETA
jgi:hypothetical protein